MLADLLGGLVHGLERRAGQLELAARLQTDRAPFGAIPAAQRDDVTLFPHRIPTEAILET